MTYKVRFTGQATKDLDTIYNYYTEEFSQTVAKKVLTRLRQTANLLTFSPEGGIDFDQKIGRTLYPGHTIRMLISKQYLLFYIVQEQEVRIMRIISSKTDYLNQLEHLFTHIKD